MTEVTIKGSSLRNFLVYIKEVFPEKYNLWLEKLPDNSKQIYNGLILNTEYYNLQNGRVIPMQILADIVFNGDALKVAYESGVYGSKIALKGIYSIFLKIPTVEFLIKRATIILNNYYQGLDIQLNNNENSLIEITIKGFSKLDYPMVSNIAGWIDNLASNVTKKPYKVNYDKQDLEDDKILGKIIVDFN